MLKGAANKTNEETEIDLGRFVAKLDTNEMEGENAWDDDDDNLDLEDHPQDTEPTRPVQLQINSIGVNDKLEKLAVNEEELSSDAEMNCSSTIASEYASPLSTTPTSFKDEIDCWSTCLRPNYDSSFLFSFFLSIRLENMNKVVVNYQNVHCN